MISRPVSLIITQKQVEKPIHIKRFNTKASLIAKVVVYFSSAVLTFRGSPCDIVVNVLDCDIVVSEFELHFRCYIHFRTNNLEKGMSLLSPELWVK